MTLSQNLLTCEWTQNSILPVSFCYGLDLLLTLPKLYCMFPSSQVIYYFSKFIGLRVWSYLTFYKHNVQEFLPFIINVSDFRHFALAIYHCTSFPIFLSLILQVDLRRRKRKKSEGLVLYLSSWWTLWKRTISSASSVTRNRCALVWVCVVILYY